MRGARPPMRRNAEELDKMRRAGRVVAEIHEATRAAIARGDHPRHRPGGPRGAGAAGRRLELPQLPRLPGGGVHLAQLDDRPRHPSTTSSWTRATSSRWTAAPSSRATTATPPTPSASARSRAEANRLMEVTEHSLFAGIDQLTAGNRLHEVGRAVQAGGRGGRVLGGAGVRRPRHRHGHARGAPGPQLLAGDPGAEAEDGDGLRRRADGQRRGRRPPSSSTTGGAW